MAKSKPHNQGMPKKARIPAPARSCRRVRYSVAMSLDGFIAGPNNEYDWIIMDPSLDFASLFKQFDTLLMGRRTFEMARKGGGDTMSGMETIVFSRTLRPKDYPKVKITRKMVETISALKEKPGKDIWLFGGGELFRNVLDAGLIDSIEVAIIPVLLSEGVPLLPAGARSPALLLTDSQTLPSGIVLLTYGVPER